MPGPFTEAARVAAEEAAEAAKPGRKKKKSKVPPVSKPWESQGSEAELVEVGANTRPLVGSSCQPERFWSLKPPKVSHKKCVRVH